MIFLLPSAMLFTLAGYFGIEYRSVTSRKIEIANIDKFQLHLRNNDRNIGN